MGNCASLNTDNDVWKTQGSMNLRRNKIAVVFAPGGDPRSTRFSSF
ncbi:hypothetical protein AM1_0911 [Acaryochloris marina MBIC11017]|uniref:Uncharacterized protein n=1 Tax=Acaryochloris marina (strain MBIC 11017) TaxID=329726 RepID=B0BZM7_ACAM1|nr:hypothetical protein AM1_0911 [Acaryochloris marina MBIC11017]